MRVFCLDPRLQDYFGSLYFFAVDVPEKDKMVDCHYPDWASINFLAAGEQHRAALWGDPMQLLARCSAHGPTSRAVCLRLGNSRSWSIGLKPAGWARYVEGPADAVANQLHDGATLPALSRFAPIQQLVERDAGDPEGTARSIEQYLIDAQPAPNPHEEMVTALYLTLRDPDIGDVDTLVQKVGASRRTIERLASRYFGFPPKLLLRRQRFLRSLGKFSLDPERTWSDSLDDHYVDQAHFVRDFRAFMGMTPSEYAKLPHPLPNAIIAHRLDEQGAHQR